MATSEQKYRMVLHWDFSAGNEAKVVELVQELITQAEFQVKEYDQYFNIDWLIDKVKDDETL